MPTIAAMPISPTSAAPKKLDRLEIKAGESGTTDATEITTLVIGAGSTLRAPSLKWAGEICLRSYAGLIAPRLQTCRDLEIYDNADCVAKTLSKSGGIFLGPSAQLTAPELRSAQAITCREDSVATTSAALTIPGRIIQDAGSKWNGVVREHRIISLPNRIRQDAETAAVGAESPAPKRGMKV